jgi:hypothetical protein
VSKTIHCIAECVCGARWEDYKTARKQAYAHAKRTGHRVSGEYAIGFVYHFKNKSPPPSAPGKEEK